MCGHKSNERYSPSTEGGNRNQLNAKFLTGCMLNAKPSVQHPTVPGPGGRKLANMDCDYKTLNKFINLANARDAKAEKNDKILSYIALEIKQHNAQVARAKGNMPNSNNFPIDKKQLPQWFVARYKL